MGLSQNGGYYKVAIFQIKLGHDFPFLPQHLMCHDPKSYFPMNSLGISLGISHENHEILGFRRSQYPQSAALLRPCTLSRGLRGRRTQASIILLEFTP